jgi:hypothetical protein
MERQKTQPRPIIHYVYETPEEIFAEQTRPIAGQEKQAELLAGLQPTPVEPVEPVTPVTTPITPVTTQVTTPVTTPITPVTTQVTTPITPVTTPVTTQVITPITPVTTPITSVTTPITPVTTPVTTPITTPVTTPITPVSSQTQILNTNKINCIMSNWSECSKKCIEGTMVRDIIQEPQNGGDPCGEKVEKCIIHCKTLKDQYQNKYNNFFELNSTNQFIVIYIIIVIILLIFYKITVIVIFTIISVLYLLLKIKTKNF